MFQRQKKASNVKRSHSVTEPNLGPLTLCSQANLLTLDCGEGKYSVYYKVPNIGSSKENSQLMLIRPKLPDGFQGRVFKDSVRECDQLMHNSLIG